MHCLALVALSKHDTYVLLRIKCSWNRKSSFQNISLYIRNLYNASTTLTDLKQIGKTTMLDNVSLPIKYREYFLTNIYVQYVYNNDNLTCPVYSKVSNKVMT